MTNKRVYANLCTDIDLWDDGLKTHRHYLEDLYVPCGYVTVYQGKTLCDLNLFLLQ